MVSPTKKGVEPGKREAYKENKGNTINNPNMRSDRMADKEKTALHSVKVILERVIYVFFRYNGCPL
jgi:hypothetical protein